MGCVASKLGEEEEVVSICRERKHQLKLAVERRYALAEAHFKYCQSLYAVAAAVKLFVARHSSPSSPFLITFSPPCTSPSTPTENVTNSTMLLQQRPSESTKESIPCEHCDSSTSSDDSSEEETEKRVNAEEQEPACGYYYMQMPPPMPSPQRDFGWDFFNPFYGMRPDVMSGYRQTSEDDLRVVREQEGIPELEEEEEAEENGVEEEEKVVVVEENVVSGGEAKEESGSVEMVKAVGGGGCLGQGEHKGLTVIDMPEKGRELLEALKDIEDHFIRAYDSGKDVSRMLEANRVHLQSGLEEIKENSTKLIQSLTWHRSTSSKPTSCKSLVASSSKGSSTWTAYTNELFDDYGGMVSGSHSLTLERLYAWEKKLYEEVKAGDNIRKLYERKCMRLRNQGVRGDDGPVMDKTRATVKDLYARILVAIRSAESISKKIEKLRDDELQPQILELLKGLTQTWKIMLESHETQNKILLEVGTFACPTYGKFCNDSHRLATLQLEAELQNWRSCFTDYIASQKAYVEALHGWLAKFVAPEVEFCSKGRSSSTPYRVNGPLLLPICHDWSASLNKLPEKAVAFALKSFAKDVRALWAQQGEEQRQKRKVDALAKEVERRTMSPSFHKVETAFLEFRPTEDKTELEIDHPELATDKGDFLETLRRKLEVEKERHHNCMQETQRITLNGFQTGFSAIFESLTEFSKASQKLYDDLVAYSESAERAKNVTHLEGSQAGGDGERR
ncbi:protein ALTERED PHOSPHATE STARVATION RESPONSE 1 [Eucalyptus grandis]|uniref:protein ALTERED PHOSPHATE STARVATION RESPONSE 1 n=1 Tax=Eucalyptus grandis TaxID=71139 RepID=UPI00192ED3C1|nr:protein ALTERED PHOSPHATE STARVATION RESPONSE 1 [Eucalyptus grandis]